MQKDKNSEERTKEYKKNLTTLYKTQMREDKNQQNSKTQIQCQHKVKHLLSNGAH